MWASEKIELCFALICQKTCLWTFAKARGFGAASGWAGGDARSREDKEGGVGKRSGVLQIVWYNCTSCISAYILPWPRSVEDQKWFQDERERKVKEAEKRVRDLEDERQRLDDELKKHVERTRRVNIGQEVLEAKMKVILREIIKVIINTLTFIVVIVTSWSSGERAGMWDRERGSEQSDQPQPCRLLLHQEEPGRCRTGGCTPRVSSLVTNVPIDTNSILPDTVLWDRRVWGRHPTAEASGGGTGRRIPSALGATAILRR